MRYHAPLVLAASVLIGTAAHAEGFTAYFLQRINNGQLAKQVTCEVLSAPDPAALQGVITAQTKAIDWDGKPLTALVLASGYPVSADWDPAKGCNNAEVPKPIPAAQTRLPGK